MRGIEVTVTLLGANLKEKKTLQKSPSQQWDGQHENRMPPVIAVTGVEAYKTLIPADSSTFRSKCYLGRVPQLFCQKLTGGGKGGGVKKERKR